ncbi:MAG: hypothetical protein Ct9H300mP22_3360 [Gammaproteobacteria bacterium]|nr:MAG: hypothetical protein Ct9H300mP22_3360 [Gammaproteobacteria bacterium]
MGALHISGNHSVQLVNHAGTLQHNDYMITHEVCHMIHMDHSRQYWNLVGSICPDYENYVDWLKAHEHRFWLINQSSLTNSKSETLFPNVFPRTSNLVGGRSGLFQNSLEPFLFSGSDMLATLPSCVSHRAPNPSPGE